MRKLLCRLFGHDRWRPPRG